jgi:hypothetical protein
MVIHSEEELQWHLLPDKGLEVALLAHANPEETHGECIGLSRAFDLAKKVGAVPVDHILYYDLMTKYKELYRDMMNFAGSNHTWLSTTLCIYTGEGRKETESKESNNMLLEFGFIEETGASMNEIVTPCDIPGKYRVFDKISEESKEVLIDELGSFIYVRIPEERENRFNVVKYPNYRLNRQGSMVLLEVDWNNAEEIPLKKLFNMMDGPEAFRTSSLLPDFIKDGFKEAYNYFHNPTLGFFAPGESYGPIGREGFDEFNIWHISTRGEAVIIQKPVQYLGGK